MPQRMGVWWWQVHRLGDRPRTTVCLGSNCRGWRYEHVRTMASGALRSPTAQVWGREGGRREGGREGRRGQLLVAQECRTNCLSYYSSSYHWYNTSVQSIHIFLLMFHSFALLYQLSAALTCLHLSMGVCFWLATRLAPEPPIPVWQATDWWVKVCVSAKLTGLGPTSLQLARVSHTTICVKWSLLGAALPVDVM